MSSPASNPSTTSASSQGWISSIVSNTMYYSSFSLGSIGNILTQPIINAGVKTFKATMNYTGLWQVPCSEASTLSEYYNALLSDGQNPPFETIPVKSSGSLNSDSVQEVVNSLKLLKFQQTDIDQNKEKVSRYFQEASDLLFPLVKTRYSNESLDLACFLSRQDPKPQLRIVPSNQPDVFTLFVETTCELQNLASPDVVESGRYEKVALIKVQAQINLQLKSGSPSINSYAPDNWKISFYPSLVAKPYLVQQDFVKNVSLGNTNLMDVKISSLEASLKIPTQLRKDLNRQAYMVGNELFVSSDLAQFCEAIFLLTDNNKDLTELICKFMTQATLSDPTKVIFDKFLNNGQPVQLPDDKCRFHVYKEHGQIKLKATVYFYLRDIDSNEKDFYNTVKGTTIINFNTGHAVVNYE
jgi:hypothetical protein